MKQKAALSVILSGILWGVTSIFIRALSAGGLDAMQITSVRMIVAASVFTVVILITDPEKLKIRLKDIWMFVGTGIISVVLFNCLYFFTIIKSQASVAVVLLYTSPVFIMIMSALLFKERITPRKITALVLTFSGCVLVAGFLGGDYSISPLILLTGLGSGFFYAMYTVFGRFALKKYDTVTVTVYTFIFGLAGSLPIGKIKSTAEALKAEPQLIFWCLCVGIISTVLPYFFYTWGLQRMEAGKAAILVAVEPLVGAIVGMTLFRESHGILKLIGIALILSAIFIMNFHSERAEENNLKK